MILISAAGSGGTNRLIDGQEENFIGVTADIYRKLTSITKKTYLISHASNERQYIEDINKISQIHNNIDLFIPNSDLEVLVTSRHIEELNIKTFIPNSKVNEICFDKWKFHKKMKELKISSPKTYLIQNYEDIYKAFKNINSNKLWCRVRKGSGSRFSSLVISPEDAKCYITHCINAYNLNLDDFLISEYLPGEDLAVLTIWKNGKMKLCKMAKRTKYSGFPGQSPPIVIESFYDDEIESFIYNAIKSLDANANGIFGADMKKYENGDIAITEINPGRFYYNMPLFNYGKINVLKTFLRLANGKDTELLKDDPGVVFLREQDNKPCVVKKEDIYKSYENW